MRNNFLLFSTTLLAMFIPHGAYADSSNNNVTLDPVIVTANPFGRTESEISQPVSVVYGDDIVKNSGTTIGEVLKNEPGIRSSYYGPNVSRPIIRGLDGDQINILQNGINNLDASATSVDHNVAIDPLSVERVEVVRGPSALLYGTKAVGGVVNIIDNRIPSEPIGSPVTGAVDLRHNTVNKERAGSFLLEGGSDEFAWHVNGFKRNTYDINIPGFAESAQLRSSEDHEEDHEEERNKLSNSHSETEGITIGFSKFFDQGYFGLAYSHYGSEYGIVGHEHAHHDEDEDDDHEEEEGDVTLDMKQNRLDFAGLYKRPMKGIKEIQYKIGYSDYEHTEFEGDETGTIFKNAGFDSRLEFSHDEISGFNGIFGGQVGYNDFEALGDEAFVPATTTLNLSGFVLEERRFKNFDVTFGGRVDYQEVDKDSSANFGTAKSRKNLTGSASVGLVYDLPQDYKISVSTAYTQRAPNAQELFANGVHVSTQTFEVGDDDLDTQKSIGLDLGVRKVKGPITGEINVFYNHFEDFIALSPAGAEDTESENPIFNYTNLPAEIYGVEARLGTNIYDDGMNFVGLQLRGDYLQVRNRKTDEHLPRIAPARIGSRVTYGFRNTQIYADTEYNFEQKDTAQNELSTDDFTMVDLGIDYNMTLGEVDTTLYATVTNLFNEEARNHVSFLKDKAPLPGRSLMVGLRSRF